MLAVRCLVTTAITAAAVRQPPLEAELAAGGLNEPLALSSILRDVGLHSLGAVQQLNAPEQLELSESLRAVGVDLGSRSRLRLLSDVAVWPTAAASSYLEAEGPVGPLCTRVCGVLHPRRVQTKEEATGGDVKGGGGPSADTLALVSTAVLGREKQIGGSGGSLEPPGPLLDPPGPLLTQLLTVYGVFCVPSYSLEPPG